MTDPQIDPISSPQGAPMARLVSVLLILGQIIMVMGFILFILTAALMGSDNGLRASLLESAPKEIEASTLFARCLAGAVVAAGWFFVLRLLRRVVAAVIHGDPFLPENVAYLRNIWIIITATEIFRMTAFFIVGGDGNCDCAQVDGSRLDINIGTWFFIFIIAAISEAFRHGAALRAEQELTI